MKTTELGITHVLEYSPRGFANEVTVLPVNREYLRRAEEITADANSDPNKWGSLHAWDAAPANLRRECGTILAGMSAKEYDEFMASMLLPAFAFDPEAYDYIDGQWVSRVAA